MHIYCDALITEAESVFSAFGDVSLIDGRTVKAEELEDADVLIVRSTCAVNERLLANTKVRFVGSATIGVDHIDLNYLQQQHIEFAHAPGCNAIAVSEYVASTLAQINRARGHGFTAAVIGFGNVGQRVAAMLERLGFSVFINDPPRLARGLSIPYAHIDLAEALQCDVVCLHTPLIKEGAWPTQHLLNEQTMASIRPETVILNAGRGAVIDNAALARCAEQKNLSLILDVFEGEPQAQGVIIQRAKRVSPHIAGHSIEGKLRGTLMVANSLANYLQQGFSQTLEDYLPERTTTDANKTITLADAVPIEHEDSALRTLARQALADNHQTIAATDFDQLRKNYPMRREFAYLPLEFKA